MRIALAGRPGSGKSTLFDLFEGRPPGPVPHGLRIAHVDVPDARLWKLSGAFRPKKTTPARLEFQELEQKSGPSYPALSPERREMLTKNDLVLLVVELFTTSPEQWTAEARTQIAEARDEFSILDLATIESRLERVRKMVRSGQKPAFPSEVDVLEELHAGLQEGRTVRDHDVVRGLEKELRGFGFLSALELLPAFNVAEDHLDRAGEISELGSLVSGDPVVFCAETERQIQELPPEERASFAEAFGLKEPAVDQTIRAAYQRVGLHSFFTVGPDEVRAWSVPHGSTAPQAAGAIHSDLEKGFICAEVVSYEDWESVGTMSKAKDKGVLRLEGKDYVVRDGDILNIRSGLAKSRG